MMVLSRSKNAATRPRCGCGCGCGRECEDVCCCWDWSAVLWGSCIGTCREKSVVGAALAAATDVVNGDVVTRVVGCYLLLSPVTRAILVGLSL